MKKLTILTGLLFLSACQSQVLTQKPVTFQNSSKAVQSKGHQTLRTQADVGSTLHLRGSRVMLEVKLPPINTFKTQGLDLSAASKITATLTDSRGKSYTPTGADGQGKVNYPVNGQLNLNFANVLPDDLLIAELQVDNGTADIPQADLAVAFKHTGVSNASATLSFQSTATAKVIKALLQANANRARALDMNALNTLMNTITGRSGISPNFTYTTHPTLVKTADLATALATQEPGALNAADYRNNGATVSLVVSGLQASDQVRVQITDAASSVQTLGNGAYPVVVTPGNALKLLASSEGTPSRFYGYKLSQETLSLAEGGSATVNIEAQPVRFVNQTATGNNDGTRWADAFTDLATALNAAQSGEQVWVAAGTYTPTTGTDRSISFVLKNNVSLYGGFSGTETLLSQQNRAANLTHLSGNIGGVGNADNTYHVLQTQGNALISGVTVLGGVATGGGIHNDGAGLLATTGTFTLEIHDTIFHNNIAAGNGGAIKSQVQNHLQNRVVFVSNQADNGGAVYSQDSQLKIQNANYYQNNANNKGGAIWTGFSMLDIGIANSNLVANTAQLDGGAIFSDAFQLDMINSNLFYNLAFDEGHHIKSSSFGFNLVRYSNSNGNFSTSYMDGMSNGGNNIHEPVDPFVISGDGDGPDNIWMTADDGLQLKPTSLSRNSGTTTPGFSIGIPTTDMLKQPRVRGAGIDMGPYENE